jgi:hypothetical protein
MSSSAAARLWAKSAESTTFPALLSMWDSRLWKVRVAVLRGLFHLVNRGEVSRLDTLEAQVPRFILTSTDFAPQFEIKAAYRQLMESISRKKEKRIAQ